MQNNTTLISNLLQGLKVIEFASVLAGPSVGMFLAELGAHVIKVENPSQGGDVTRSWKLPSEDPNANTSSYYASINWGKSVVYLDLKNKEEHQKAIELCNDADVVISNFKSSSAKKLGLNYDQLKSNNAKLIYAQLFAFAEQDIRPAYDVVLQAETGFLSMCGANELELAKMPVALIDVLAAHQLKEGILLALFQRATKGFGAYVTASLYDAAIASLINQASGHLMTGHIPKPIGTKHPNIAPYGDIYITKDQKKIVLAIGSHAQFERLCEVLSIQEIATDFRFNTNPQRLKHRTELNQILSKAIQSIERETFADLALKNNIPFGRILNLKEVFQNPTAQQLVLESESGKTPRSAIFKIR